MIRTSFLRGILTLAFAAWMPWCFCWYGLAPCCGGPVANAKDGIASASPLDREGAQRSEAVCHGGCCGAPVSSDDDGERESDGDGPAEAPSPIGCGCQVACCAPKSHAAVSAPSLPAHDLIGCVLPPSLVDRTFNVALSATSRPLERDPRPPARPDGRATLRMHCTLLT